MMVQEKKGIDKKEYEAENRIICKHFGIKVVVFESS